MVFATTTNLASGGRLARLRHEIRAGMQGSDWIDVQTCWRPEVFADLVRENRQVQGHCGSSRLRDWTATTELKESVNLMKNNPLFIFNLHDLPDRLQLTELHHSRVRVNLFDSCPQSSLVYLEPFHTRIFSKFSKTVIQSI